MNLQEVMELRELIATIETAKFVFRGVVKRRISIECKF